MPNGTVQFVNKINKSAVNNDEWNEVEGFVNGFAKAYGNGFWTLVDKNGSPISKNKYDAVRNFSNGYAAVNTNNKWGFINEQGKTMIPTEYDIVFDFKENVTAVYKNKKWLLIDETGMVKKALDIDVFYGFKNKTAAILKDGRKGKMNLDGDIISLEADLTAASNNQFITKQSFLALRPQSVPCPPNIGFDLNNFTNWNCFIGSVSSSGTANIITVVPSAPLPTRHVIYGASTGLDPYGLFPTAPPDGSGFALKLGNNINGSKAERVTYQLVIPVGSTDASITYRYAVVFQDPGHLTQQQPRFSAKLKDVVTNTYLPCASYEYIANSSIPGFFDSPVDDTVKCKNWSSVFINLSAYAGKTLNLEFTTADCTLGAHWGYAYVDVGDCNIAANIAYQCSPSVATVNAPPGFQYYNWWNSNFTQILATGQNTTISPIPANNSTLHVEVIPFNGAGCKDTLDVLVGNIYGVADAGPDKTICAGNAVSIGSTSGSLAPGDVYSWSPATYLSNASIANPIANPPVSSTYILTVTNPANLCPKYDTVNIIINPKPIPAFSTPPSQCISGNNFSFNNTSTGGATYHWNFGDGTTSNTPSPSHTYTTPAAYTVKLVVTTSNGCKDSISQIINVFAKPTPAFAVPPGQCISGNNFVFNNNSTGGTTYLWNFGDGTTSYTVSPSHTYATAAAHTVKLVVTNSNGCKDSISQSINVFAKPNPAFAVPPGQCVSGNNFTFNNSSTGGATYLWLFGDGTTSNQQNPTHSYTTANNYTVKLIVTNSNGCKDSISQSVNVFAKPTPAFAVPPGQCISGNNFTFNNSSTGGATYLWNFGDGTTSNQQNPTHSYATAAAYTVKLVVTNSNGCKDSISQSINVFAKPNPAFAVPPGQCVSGNNFTFNNSSTGGATYLWLFGDGTTSNQQNPTHSYTTANNYTVKLIVTNSNGCKDSISQSVNVFAKPTPAFAVPPGQCISGNNFTFNNSSTGGATYLWNFGDGTTSNQQNPTHSYATAAAYTVKLVVTNSNGCTDSVSNILSVYPTPQPAFVPPTNQCVNNNNFNFVNQSTGGATYLWNFGDGATSSLVNPSHTYTTPGNYNINLVITSANGCADSIMHPVTIFARPVAAFDPPASQCLTNNNFSFLNNSTGASNYLWNFGDGTSSNALNAQHSYSAAGSYTIQLLTTNASGCRDSIQHTVVINSSPVITMGNNYNVCAGNSVQLSAQGAQTYQWSPTQGLSCSTCPNPVATPGSNITYTLNASSTAGCNTTGTVSIIVQQPLQINVSPNMAVCGRARTNLFAVGANTYKWSPAAGLSSTIIPNPVASPDTTTTYMVIGYDLSGCFKDTGYVKITVNPIPAIELGPDVTLPTGTVFQMQPQVLSGPIVSWLWTPAINLSCTNCPTPTTAVKFDIAYNAQVRNIYGCVANDSIRIHTFCEGSQVFVPNAFTPDGDGRNDILMVRSSGVNLVRSFKIYSRWGELIFEKNNFPPNSPAYGWDGRIKGKIGSAEVYVYTLEVTCDNNEKIVFKGNLSILN